MKLKQAVVACSLLLPVGILAAGAQAYQQASDGPDKIVVGGKTYRAEPEGPEIVAKTYYVGDLIGAALSPKVKADKTPTPEKPKGDFAPVVKLITGHIAPGTWQALDNAGGDISASYGVPSGNGGKDDRRIGSITPFLLSISLIVRHTEETHKQIASLLEDVRDVMYRPTPKPIQADDLALELSLEGKTPLETENRRSWTSGPAPKKTEIVEVGPHGKVVVHRGSIDQAPTGRFFVPTEHLADFFGGVPAPGSPPVTMIESRSPKTSRVRRLLQQLQSELDALDATDAPTPSQRKDLKGDFEPTIRPLDRSAADRPRKPS